MTGRVIECSIDEMDRPRVSKDAALRILPTEPVARRCSPGWGGEPATCREFALTARNYTASKLTAATRGGALILMDSLPVSGDVAGNGPRASGRVR
ncbi:hypothetical protein [Streptomyces lydicus]|uniref:hypothetical protein n=1 Tax=Streptomyces lydicus TaxID=47763 RepID=UPI001F509A01|nr:hypothetical protein [Streptomyces lydicus]MCZ1011524.1 hypothetical protein [Streptomyces lydicus]